MDETVGCMAAARWPLWCLCAQIGASGFGKLGDPSLLQGISQLHWFEDPEVGTSHLLKCVCLSCQDRKQLFVTGKGNTGQASLYGRSKRGVAIWGVPRPRGKGDGRGKEKGAGQGTQGNGLEWETKRQ